MCLSSLSWVIPLSYIKLIPTANVIQKAIQKANKNKNIEIYFALCESISSIASALHFRYSFMDYSSK
jgi:hypothetical protein